MKLLLALGIGILTSVTGFLGYQQIDTLGAAVYPASAQLAASPTNGYVLSTDGSVNSWISLGAGSQTPWTSNIDADGYNLTNLGDLLMTGVATSTRFITSGGDSDDWNTAFGWGDHSTQGYLTTVDISDDTNLAVTSPITLTGDTVGINQSLLSITESQISDLGRYLLDTGDDATVADTGNRTVLTLNQNDITNNPAGLLINNAGTGSGFSIVSDTTSSSEINFYDFYWNRSATDNIDGLISYYFNNDAAEKLPFVSQNVWTLDTTDGTEDGYIAFSTYQDGLDRQRLSIGEGVNGISVGSSQASGVVESDGNQDLILQTGNTTTGDITIIDGADGDIQINPNGNGEFVINSNFNTNGFGISENFIGASDDSYSLGTSGRRWYDLYLGDTASIYMSGINAIYGDSTSLTINPNGVDRNFVLESDTLNILSMDAGTNVTTLLGTWAYGGATVTGIPQDKSWSIASTSPDYQGNTLATATTTWSVAHFASATTLNSIRCETDTGTAKVRIGDGTNWTEVVNCSATPTRDTSLSNGTFTAEEDFIIQIGSSASSPNWVTVDMEIER